MYYDPAVSAIGERRVDQAADAARLLATMMDPRAAKGLSRIGLISFGTTATDASKNSPLFNVTADFQAQLIKNVTGGPPGNQFEGALENIENKFEDTMTSLGAGMQAATDALCGGQPCTGNKAFIVLTDGLQNSGPCIPDASNNSWCNGSFFNLGQNCISAERILVQRTLYPEFLRLVKERMAKVRQGIDNDEADPKDFGAMTMSAQLEKAHSLIGDAVKNGAKLISGGSRRSGQGLFLEPTVLADVNERCLLWREEAFGPVMLVIPVKGA